MNKQPRSRLAQRWATPFTKQKIASYGRTLAPALVALAFASAAHAQGTMDFSGAQTLMGTFKTFAIYAGAVICFGGLIFAGIRMMSGRFSGRDSRPFRRAIRCRGSGLGRRLDRLPDRAVDVSEIHMTKRGEPLPINQALNRPRAKLGLDLSAWMAIVFVTRNGFPRWVPDAGDLEFPDAFARCLADRPQAPKDVSALGPEPHPEALL